MEQTKIIEGNCQIAEALGAKQGHNAREGMFYYGIPYRPPCSYLPTELKYHSSWDWIMPVVDWIEKQTVGDGRGEVNYCFSIDSGYIVISREGEAPEVEIQYDPDDTTKLEAVYEACVDFIRHFNEIKAEGE